MTRVARLTVVTYNVHGFVGADGRFNAQRIVDVLDDLDADVIALQEVEHRSIAGTGVADWLAAALGMHATRGDTFRRAQHDYGNLLLTRSRPIEVRRHDLSVAGREPRGAIEARIGVDGAEWRVVATHLGLAARERRIQLDRLASILASGPPASAVVAAGDFNEWRPFARSIRRLGTGFGTPRSPRTFPASRPAIALDRIVAQPAGAIERIRRIDSTVARIASDHLPLVATLCADR